jgi:hypothetical protein
MSTHSLRGKYSHKPKDKTLSKEMDAWAAQQQAKHTYEKRVKKDVKKLLREVAKTT